MRQPCLMPLISLLTPCLLAVCSGAAQASPHHQGPCSGKLQNLGYREVELDGVRAHVSLYEARRGHEEVKLMVDNGSCAVRESWIDD